MANGHTHCMQVLSKGTTCFPTLGARLLKRTPLFSGAGHYHRGVNAFLLHAFIFDNSKLVIYSTVSKIDDEDFADCEIRHMFRRRGLPRTPPPHPTGTQSEKIQRDPTKAFSCHLSMQNKDCMLDQLVRVFIVLGLDPALRC
jgi:hypothetical protein